MIRALALLGALLLATPGRADPVWQVDPSRSSADFSIRLFWVHAIVGRFPRVDGEVRRSPGGELAVTARVAVDSLVMHSARTRRWTLAPPFFDAARYPDIRFRSDPVPPATLTAGGTLAGRLTLRGVTRPVRFELQPSACAGTAQATCVLRVHGSIARSRFGMTTHQHALADEVTLDLRITLRRATG